VIKAECLNFRSGAGALIEDNPDEISIPPWSLNRANSILLAEDTIA
jgi:hypothetical protein